MKILIICMLTIVFQKTVGQSYEQYMDLAASQIELKKYNEALLTFKKAFKKNKNRGKYDYASAVVAAIQCDQPGLAIKWLNEGVQLGLGDNQQELDYFKNDSLFNYIGKDKAYKKILKKMEAKIQEKYDRDRIWQQELKSNVISKKQTLYQKAPWGGALYFVEQDTLKIPYIVFVPKTYDSYSSSRTLIFLHGGVGTNEELLMKDSQTRLEPIFSIGDSINSIVIYPLQIGNLGWKNYEHASSIISKIVAEVKLRYFVDLNRIYLGGLSTGGNICYRFARESTTPFRAFYTISAKPIRNDFESGNGVLAVTNSIYSLHAKDDSLYTYAQVIEVHQQVERYSKKWKLSSIETGGHGFPYLKSGRRSTLTFFRMIFAKEE